MKTHWSKATARGGFSPHLWALFLSIVWACTGGDGSTPEVLRLATTTSTRDSGLLEILVPLFEEQENCRVDVVAVGTGAALRLGAEGEAEAVLVHAEEAELKFMRSGFGVRREPVMYNRFTLLGPRDDPARVTNLRAHEALQRIRASGSPFVSRGDDSGTHKKERLLWKRAGVDPNWSDYIESGRGMGATLVMASELRAYVLSDEGTWRRLAGKLSLKEVVTEGEEMRNPYAVIVVAPARTQRARRLADRFADFMISERIQRMIRDFKVGGRSLFHPVRLNR